MSQITRMLLTAVMCCGIIFSISTPAVSAGHEQGGQHGDHDDGPPSPEEIKAMDQGIRERIDKLPPGLKEKAHKIQDLHMQLMLSAAKDGPNTGEMGRKFFSAAIPFMKGLAEDPKAHKNPAVHELVHFIANAFGQGDVPKAVPTIDLLRDEVEHLKDEMKGFSERGQHQGQPGQPAQHRQHHGQPGQHHGDDGDQGDNALSEDGALLVGPGMFENIPPECTDDLRNSELQPQGTEQRDGVTGNLIFRTVCNTQGNEKNFITLPAGREAGAFGIEAATEGKIRFGIRVEGGAPVWETADGKAAFDSLHLESTTPSPNGKYEILIDSGKSDPNVRVTVSFIDFPSP